MGQKPKGSTLESIALLVTILGGMAYVTYVSFQGSANAQAIDSLNKKTDSINEINTRLAVMESEIKQIHRILKNDE